MTPLEPLKKPFSLEFQVRDYELDQYGVVNNAAYLNYLEHARHEFLVTLGIDPAEVARQGRSLALAGIDVRFQSPLRSRERFVVQVTLSKLTGARAVFHQKISRLPAATPVLEAWAEAVFLNQAGGPQRIAPAHREAFLPYLEDPQ